MLLNQIRNLEQIAGPLMRANFWPFTFFIRFARGLYCLIDVGLVALGHQRQHFFVGRIDSLEGFARLCGYPFAADEQLFGLPEEPSTALEVTPRAAFSIDGTAAAISFSSDVG